MKFFRPAAAGFSLILATASPCLAQMSMGGPSSGTNSPPPAARPEPSDIAPAGLPGAGQAPIATGPVVQKPSTGDPTQELFAAVNSGDYNAAQDAISRGADLTAQDAFGETALDLAVSLNRSNITFLILQARNEDGGGGVISPGPAFPGGMGNGHEVAATPAKVTAPARPVPVMGNDPGTPNPSAGFLGFGSKN